MVNKIGTLFQIIVLGETLSLYDPGVRLGNRTDHMSFGIPFIGDAFEHCLYRSLFKLSLLHWLLQNCINKFEEFNDVLGFGIEFGAFRGFLQLTIFRLFNGVP